MGGEQERVVGGEEMEEDVWWARWRWLRHHTPRGEIEKRPEVLEMRGEEVEATCLGRQSYSGEGEEKV